MEIYKETGIKLVLQGSNSIKISNNNFYRKCNDYDFLFLEDDNNKNDSFIRNHQLFNKVVKYFDNNLKYINDNDIIKTFETEINGSKYIIEFNLAKSIPNSLIKRENGFWMVNTEYNITSKICHIITSIEIYFFFNENRSKKIENAFKDIEFLMTNYKISELQNVMYKNILINLFSDLFMFPYNPYSRLNKIENELKNIKPKIEPHVLATKLMTSIFRNQKLQILLKALEITFNLKSKIIDDLQIKKDDVFGFYFSLNNYQVEQFLNILNQYWYIYLDENINEVDVHLSENKEIKIINIFHYLKIFINKYIKILSKE
ncbi:hypothetical protein H9M94_02915 [Mycoplasma sp. Pen4]|uniref:hypothetical protein n=1 Tax=Mycoplasma sp. Pen4 TaxID=640330 RepID=UPI00165453B6|nr:hypothetical protein [Mycoplasma sp. Pen4]QNM93538.1 hypothetical protein H9M94_02915 [Mycoplasma sp. Pen4]